MFLPTLQAVLTKYKRSLLLEGKPLVIFVANRKILFNQSSQLGTCVHHHGRGNAMVVNYFSDRINGHVMNV